MRISAKVQIFQFALFAQMARQSHNLRRIIRAIRAIRAASYTRIALLNEVVRITQR